MAGVLHDRLGGVLERLGGLLGGGGISLGGLGLLIVSGLDVLGGGVGGGFGGLA